MINQRLSIRVTLIITLIGVLTAISTRLNADTGTCGGTTITLPFTDVMGNPFFCQIAEAYLTGLTNGTSATTFSPSQDVTRDQMAAFMTRTMDRSLQRGSRRAALQQFSTPEVMGALQSVGVGIANDITSDGRYLWVTLGGRVAQVEAADGIVLRYWTGPIDARKIIVAAGRIFFTEPVYQAPGRIYVIDPSRPESPVATVFENNTGDSPFGIAFDGTYLWTANRGEISSPGSITRVRIDSATETTFTSGFTVPFDIFWDGTSLWVTDISERKLKRIDRTTGSVIEDIDVGISPRSILFDGINLWVVNQGSNSISIVRPGTPSRVIQTLTGNGMDEPTDLAFDGERVIVTSQNGDRVSLFRASDLFPLGSLSTGPGSRPDNVCSDGLNFWITRHQGSDIVRF